MVTRGLKKPDLFLLSTYRALLFVGSWDSVFEKNKAGGRRGRGRERLGVGGRGRGGRQDTTEDVSVIKFLRGK